MYMARFTNNDIKRQNRSNSVKTPLVSPKKFAPVSGGIVIKPLTNSPELIPTVDSTDVGTFYQQIIRRKAGHKFK